MIHIEGIPIVAARLAAAQKKERLKRRRAMRKVWQFTMKGEARKPWSARDEVGQSTDLSAPL
jgi:hypothetical protein